MIEIKSGDAYQAQPLLHRVTNDATQLPPTRLFADTLSAAVHL